MFEEGVREKHETMRINTGEYNRFLSTKFGAESEVFNRTIKFFNSSSTVGNNVEFNCFWRSNYGHKSTETELFNWAYELYNNLKRFYVGGVFHLFKYKQAEWGAPEILITEADVPNDNQKNLLGNPHIVFRGLQKREHESKDYYQSWTTDQCKAREFATKTYSGQPNGIVVQARVSTEDVLYYNEVDPEKEVVVKKAL